MVDDFLFSSFVRLALLESSGAREIEKDVRVWCGRSAQLETRVIYLIAGHAQLNVSGDCVLMTSHKIEVEGTDRWTLNVNEAIQHASSSPRSRTARGTRTYDVVLGGSISQQAFVDFTNANPFEKSDMSRYIFEKKIPVIVDKIVYVPRYRDNKQQKDKLYDMFVKC